MMRRMPTEQRDWYDTPLYYDIVFDDGTRQEADFLEAAFAKHARPARGRRLFEPACGSGRLAMEMARRGWNVNGFDGNAYMIAFAKERLAAAGLEHAGGRARPEAVGRRKAACGHRPHAAEEPAGAAA
jgi:2-polyprenyl-3-methyl-5-hydroxy-6-metoxy-1,4-benzoquinol methylase